MLVCLVGTLIHFVMATRDLKAYYSLKYSSQCATKAMLKTVFPFGVAILLPALLCPPPTGKAIFMTFAVGVAALWQTVLALNEWFEQRPERVSTAGR